MPRLRKTLPRNLSDQMKTACETGDESAVRAILERCLVDARGGYGKQTALMLEGCSPALARWLVEERGLDVDATDEFGRTALHHSAHAAHHAWRYLAPVALLLELGADPHHAVGSGKTPLHAAADGGNVDAIRLLLAHGARVDARGRRDGTPLEFTLQRVTNTHLQDRLAGIAALLEAGAEVTEAARSFAFEAAQRVYQYRCDRETVDAALELCARIGIEPPERPAYHCGTSPITVSAAHWSEQHEELWSFLVPPAGPCRIVQGEVVRIAGRVADEVHRNGGANWDRAYDLMMEAFRAHVASHGALDPEELETLGSLASPPDAEETHLLARAAVAWVLRNPDPIPLEPPPYRR